VSARTNPRDPWFDNAKMMLVTLVVIGHAIAFAPSTDASTRVYDWLYYAHMPAFVLITGHLSTTFAWTRRHLTALVTTLAVPYVVFEGLMALFRVDVGGEEPLDQLWIDPHWPMWYLAALFCWRLMTPLLKRHWVAVPLSVVASVLAPLTSFDVLDLDRVLGFLPFFVLGLHLRREHLALVREPGTRLVAVLLLGWLWWLAGRTDDWISTEWLYYRSSYDEMDVATDLGMLVRALMVGIGLVGTYALLALVPRGRSWFTAFGAASLVVYLVHGFVLRGLEYVDFWDAFTAPWAALGVTVVVGTLVTVLLAWPPVAQRLMPLVDPVGTLRAFHDRREAARVERADAPGAAGAGQADREPEPAGR
jgi:fucose 4-O-acetylase-like acetyltransferase